MVNGKKIIKAGLHNQESIVIAKHSITLIDERPISAQEIAQAYEKSEPSPSTPTGEEQPEVPSSYPPVFDKIGAVRITEGVVDQPEFTLKDKPDTSSYPSGSVYNHGIGHESKNCVYKTTIRDNLTNLFKSVPDKNRIILILDDGVEILLKD
jgi:hypothetical protein